MPFALAVPMTTRRGRLVRMGCSGAFSCAIDVVLLILLVEQVEIPVGAAAFFAAASGALASFVINKFWAFRDRRPVHIAQLLAFAMVALGSAVGTACLVHVLSKGFGLPYLGAKAIGAALLFLCWSYPVQSRLVFRHVRA